MFVSEGAVKKIRNKRKTAFYDRYIVPLLDEASNLDITKGEIADMIKIHPVDMVIFDDELTPAQVRNWEQLTQQCGWSSRQYISRIQSVARCTFVRDQ